MRVWKTEFPETEKLALTTSVPSCCRMRMASQKRYWLSNPLLKTIIKPRSVWLILSSGGDDDDDEDEEEEESIFMELLFFPCNSFFFSLAEFTFFSSSFMYLIASSIWSGNVNEISCDAILDNVRFYLKINLFERWVEINMLFHLSSQFFSTILDNTRFHQVRSFFIFSTWDLQDVTNLDFGWWVLDNFMLEWNKFLWKKQST